MKLYIKQDVMEIQTIIILKSQGVKESRSQRRKCFAGETTPFLLYSLDNNNCGWKKIEEDRGR